MNGAKTWKRETALGMLVFLGGMFVWGVSNPGALAVATTLMTPVFLFVGGAFGLDSLAKQFEVKR